MFDVLNHLTTMSLESVQWPTGSTCPIVKPIKSTNFYEHWTVDEFNDECNNSNYWDDEPIDTDC